MSEDVFDNSIGAFDWSNFQVAPEETPDFSLLQSLPVATLPGLDLEIKRNLRTLEHDLETAKKQHNRKTQMDLLIQMANHYYMLREFSSGLRIAEELLALAQDEWAVMTQAVAHNLIGKGYYFRGERQLAVHSITQAVEIAERLKAGAQAAKWMTNLAGAYLGLGAIEKAIEILDKTLSIARQLDDKNFEVDALLGYGLALSRNSDVERAVDIYNEAYRLAHENKLPRKVLLALGNLGVAYRFLGRNALAIQTYHHTLDLANRLGDRSIIASTSWNLGLMIKDDDPDETTRLMSFWIQFLDSTRDPRLASYQQQFEDLTRH